MVLAPADPARRTRLELIELISQRSVALIWTNKRPETDVFQQLLLLRALGICQARRGVGFPTIGLLTYLQMRKTEPVGRSCSLHDVFY